MIRRLFPYLTLTCGLAFGQVAYVGGSFNTIRLFDTTTNAAIEANMPSVGNSLRGFTLSPDGKRVYVASDAFTGLLTILSTATQTSIGNVAISRYPEGIAISPDGSRAYVASSTGVLDVVDTVNRTVITTIPIPSGPGGNEAMGVAITPDGLKVYVTNWWSNKIAVISTAGNTVIGTIPLVTSVDFPGIVMAPDGAHVYVANHLASNIAVISTVTDTVTATIPVPALDYGIAITPDGSKLLAATTTGVAVISTASNTVTATIATEAGNFAIAVTPDGAKAFVTSNSPNPGVVISLESNTVTGSFVSGDSLGIVIAPGAAAATPAPTVTAVNPRSGLTAGGTVVTITGAYFTGATSVTFAGHAAAAFSVVNATTITATTPAGTAGNASVVVTTPNGSNPPNTLYAYTLPPTIPTVPTVGFWEMIGLAGLLALFGCYQSRRRGSAPADME